MDMEGHLDVLTLQILHLNVSHVGFDLQMLHFDALGFFETLCNRLGSFLWIVYFTNARTFLLDFFELLQQVHIVFLNLHLPLYYTEVLI